MNIGTLQLKDKPLFLAPMHEVTDIPFRLICKRLGADVVVSEFVSVEALIREVDKAKQKMRILEEERPAGIQIFGKNVESFERAIDVVERFQPDFIDINAGCAAGKHATRGECAGLLRDLPLFEKIIQATVKATKIPVTVKTRLGWDKDSIVILEVAKMIENAGAKALTVHCRTRKQSYKHPADLTWLEKIKNVISIPLIGNGDITCAGDVRKMFETGCDAVMIGRGAIANPWIFKESAHLLATAEHLPSISLEERIKTCIEHLHLYSHYNNIQSGLYAFRKFFAGYLKGIPGISRLRKELMKVSTLDEIEEQLTRYLNEADQSHDPDTLS